MTDYTYCVSPLRVSGRSAFTEASREELRVLLLLIEREGDFGSYEELAALCEISPARCKSAIAFWEESGVITKREKGENVILEEFEERLRAGEIAEEAAVTVAESIRNDNLASMLDECAILMGQACLSNAEIKSVTALYTQYSLSPEYIITLAAYLAGKGRLTVRALCNKAIDISRTGCDSVEALENYINNKEEGAGAYWEIRRVLGIYGRNLSPSEKSYFRKWSEEFGYSVAIISEAYDIAVLVTSGGRGTLPYMDSVLTSWHEAGCKTVAECKAHSESHKPQKEQTQEPKRRAKSAPTPPRYGEFDINTAFDNALKRSYGED